MRTKVFDQVYQADKNYPGLSARARELFEQSGRLDEGARAVPSALSNTRTTWTPCSASGVALASSKPEEAIPLLKKVLQQQPNSAEAEHYLGRAR